MSTPRWANRLTWLSIIVLSVFVLGSPRRRQQTPVLEIAIGGVTRHFARDALLARPDVTNVEIADDVAYGKAMRFRAIPLAALLAGLSAPADSVIETVALDGFAAQLPLDLVTNTDPAKAVAWLAIEPADAPWPPLPGKTASAGPFYIVWTGAAVATIRSEQWPYQVAKLDSQPSPAARWPALGVDPALPATHAVRAGQALFVTQCLPCHTAQRRRLQHCRSRHEQADEPDRVLDARRAARADPRPEIGPQFGPGRSCPASRRIR